MKNKYQLVESEAIFKGEVLSLKLDKVKMPDGTVVEREVVEHKGAVGIVPILGNGKVVLVTQYRHPTGDVLLEIPAGKLDEGEDHYKCALRELEEETGYKADKLTKLAVFYTTPGYSDELFYLYLTDSLTQGVMNREGDEEQDLEVVLLDLDEALALIPSGKIKDGKTIAGLSLAKFRLKSEV